MRALCAHYVSERSGWKCGCRFCCIWGRPSCPGALWGAFLGRPLSCKFCRKCCKWSDPRASACATRTRPCWCSHVCTPRIKTGHSPQSPSDPLDPTGLRWTLRFPHPTRPLRPSLNNLGCLKWNKMHMYSGNALWHFALLIFKWLRWLHNCRNFPTQMCCYSLFVA